MWGACVGVYQLLNSRLIMHADIMMHLHENKLYSVIRHHIPTIPQFLHSYILVRYTVFHYGSATCNKRRLFMKVYMHKLRKAGKA